MSGWWKDHWRPLADAASQINAESRGLHGFDVSWLEVVAERGIRQNRSWSEDDAKETIQQMAVAMLVCRERIAQLERAATVGRDQR